MVTPVQDEEACSSHWFNRQSQRLQPFFLSLPCLSYLGWEKTCRIYLYWLPPQRKNIPNGQTLSGMLSLFSKFRVSSTRTQENQCVPIPISSICWSQQIIRLLSERFYKYKYYVMLRDEFMSWRKQEIRSNRLLNKTKSFDDHVTPHIWSPYSPVLNSNINNYYVWGVVETKTDNITTMQRTRWSLLLGTSLENLNKVHLIQACNYFYISLPDHNRSLYTYD